MDENKQKTLIVESSQIIRAGLRQILMDSFGDIYIINMSSLEELEKYPEKRDVSLIILNPGIIWTYKNRAGDALGKFPKAKTIGVITNHYDRSQMSLFDDLIFINDDRENICRIIKNNLSGAPNTTFANRKLTKRELDVLRLLVKGYSNKQIAGDLFISIHTVVTHRKNITEKLGIKSIAGLTIYGIINNIIDVDDYLNEFRQ